MKKGKYEKKKMENLQVMGSVTMEEWWWEWYLE